MKGSQAIPTQQPPSLLHHAVAPGKEKLGQVWSLVILVMVALIPPQASALQFLTSPANLRDTDPVTSTKDRPKWSGG